MLRPDLLEKKYHDQAEGSDLDAKHSSDRNRCRFQSLAVSLQLVNQKAAEDAVGEPPHPSPRWEKRTPHHSHIGHKKAIRQDPLSLNSANSGA